MKALIHILFAFLLVQVLFAASTKAAHTGSSPTLDQLIGSQTGKQGYVLTSDGQKTTLQPLPAAPTTEPTPTPTPTPVPLDLTIARKAGAYTLTASDAQNVLLVFDNPSQATLTIPADVASTDSTPTPIGSVIRGLALTDYDVVLTPATGVKLITPPGGGNRTEGAGASFTLIKTGPNEWSASGALYSQTYTTFPGQSHSLSVRITSGLGSPPRTFQWSKDGAEIAGATAPTYTIPSVSVGDSGTYTVRVSNTAGSVVSGTYILDVVAP